MLSLPGGDGAGHLPTEPIALRWPQMGAGEERRALVKERGNSLTEPGHSGSGGYRGEVLPSVNDWYSIFRCWNVCFVGSFPWLRGIY